MAIHQHLIGPLRRLRVTNRGSVPCFVGIEDEEGRLRVLERLEPGQSALVPQNAQGWTDEGTAQIVFSEDG
jgi:hypothetical protein